MLESTESIRAPITLTRRRTRLRRWQHPLRLSHQHEEHAVHQACELGVILRGIEPAGVELSPQGVIVGVSQKAVAERCERTYHMLRMRYHGLCCMRYDHRAFTSPSPRSIIPVCTVSNAVVGTLTLR